MRKAHGGFFLLTNETTQKLTNCAKFSEWTHQMGIDITSFLLQHTS